MLFALAKDRFGIQSASPPTALALPLK